MEIQYAQTRQNFAQAKEMQKKSKQVLYFSWKIFTLQKLSLSVAKLE